MREIEVKFYCRMPECVRDNRNMCKNDERCDGLVEGLCVKTNEWENCKMCEENYYICPHLIIKRVIE